MIIRMKKDLNINILRINMDYKVQYILNNNYYLKRFLRENSNFYKDLIRNPNYINELNEIMKKEYDQNPTMKLTRHGKKRN